MILRCDFHLHSCLSPCADLGMSPSAIAEAAHAAGLDAVALTDHNTARNTPAFAEACRRAGLRAFYGLEVSTVEEIHCIALFATPDAALAFGGSIYPHLPDFPNIPEKLGDQPVVDADENILDFEPRYLGSSTDIPYTVLPFLVESAGGLFWPAHIDRPASGVLGQLGTLPSESGPILEITRHHVPEMTAAYGATHTLLTASDAHFLPDIASNHTLIDFGDSAFSLPALRAALLRRAATPVFHPPAPAADD